MPLNTFPPRFGPSPAIIQEGTVFVLNYLMTYVFKKIKLIEHAAHNCFLLLYLSNNISKNSLLSASYMDGYISKNSSLSASYMDGYIN